MKKVICPGCSQEQHLVAADVWHEKTDTIKKSRRIKFCDNLIKRRPDLEPSKCFWHASY